MSTGSKKHWEQAYTAKSPDEVSWFEETPATSLSLVDEAGIGAEASILDVGGGASHLARELHGRGHRDITVADISSAALEAARGEIPANATGVSFVQADVRDHDFGRQFDLWHDRAVFHFMVEPADRDAYLATMVRTLRSDGYLILATFGPEGPKQCSGLPVSRYDAEGLARLLGEDFRPLASELHVHGTPSGNSQQFQYAMFQRRAAG